MPLNYQWSHWEFDSFFKDIDYCIVGSGIVGLSTAIHIKFKQPEAKVVVLERGVLPIGASTRNAGFACFGSVSELLDDLSHTSEDEVWALVEQRYQGLLALRDLLGDAAIGYLPEGGYEIFNQQDAEVQKACLDAVPVFNQQLQSITGRPDTFTVLGDAPQEAFGFSGVQKMILNQAEGSIDTGKMMYSLLRKAQSLDVLILNRCEVQQFEDREDRVELSLTNGWELSVRHLVVATNGFARQLLPDQDLAPARNQVLITQPVPNHTVKGCFHYDRGYFYFRNVGDRILLGGGRHLDKTGETTTEFAAHTRIRQALVDLLEEVIIPGQTYEIDRWWTGILGVSHHKKPILKRQGSTTIAVRMGGMGVAIGTLVGKMAADLAVEH